jgi:predicted molibdopterin-dependent oxidoreductase YjgC
MDVNEYWICDRGRYEWTGSEESDTRLKDPIVRRGESFEITDWEEALSYGAGALTRISRESPQSVAFLASAELTNEELYLLKKIGETLGADKIASSIGLINEKKILGLLSTDPYPNSTGVKDLGYPYGSNRVLEVIDSILAGEVKALYTAGIDLFDFVLEEDKPRVREALSGLSLLIAMDTKLTETLKLAHVILPGASAFEKDGTFTNDRGRVQRVRKAISPPGTSKAEWEILTLVGREISEELFNYEYPAEIMLDIARDYPAYRDISYEIIGMLGVNRAG